MKRIFTIMAAVLLAVSVFAQTPEKMSYQAVVRNSSDQLVSNTQVGMQISILQSTADGAAVYVENHNPTTNANGLLSIEIGGGTAVSGDFNTINWAGDTYFIKTETDPTGGTNYSITGTSQLLSVAYALHAKTAETVSGGINETDPKFTNWDKSTGISITKSQVTDFGTYLEAETDPKFTNWDKSTGISITKSQVTDFGTYLEAETDPKFTNWDKSTGISITKSQVTDFGTYLEAETDPKFTNWDKSTGISITKSQVTDFGTYLTTETQNLQEVLSQNNSANNQRIINLANPTNDKDAANKAYVDAIKQEIRLEMYAEIGVTDSRDGKHYNAVKIGNQVWMAENLKYLPSVVGVSTGSSTQAYCYVYGYNGTDVTAAKATANYQTYGVLYNWSAVMNGEASSTANPSGIQGICPTGWHVPSNAEWMELINYLGGTNVAGGKLKEVGTTHWTGPNTTATNESGFTALPGGLRNLNGSFHNLENYGVFWTSTEGDSNNAWWRSVNYGQASVRDNSTSKQDGYSVRCIKN